MADRSMVPVGCPPRHREGLNAATSPGTIVRRDGIPSDCQKGRNGKVRDVENGVAHQGQAKEPAH